MTKAIQFLAGPLFCCTALMADPLMQGEILAKEQYLAGYSAPARVVLDQNPWRPDISFDLAFLYYYAGQDGLDLANSGAIVTGGLGGATVVATSNSRGLVQEFAYKPGFMVGFGIDWDEWTSNAEYTWIRQTTSTDKGSIVPNPATGSGVWLLNNWFQQTTSVGQTISATDISSKWHLSMDLVDVTMGRPFYEGRDVSISPFFGVRGAWIRQKLNIAIAPSDAISVLRTTPIHSNNSSRSWALGPRTGFETYWLLGQGIRLEGDAAVSLLFTQYTNIHHTEQVASASSSPDTLSSKLSNINCVRPEFDLGVGLGWGMYLQDQKYYIDLAANYEFLLFWQQNMMRKLGDQTVVGVGAAAGDLYLQGLKIRGCFYF